MAIDSSLFAANIPAGAYSVGDIVQLKCIDGPSTVRSGRGTAILKQIMVGNLNSGSNPVRFRIHVKNSNWVDEVASFSAAFGNATALDDHSGLIQFGNDCNLTENSGWQIYAECTDAGTSLADGIFALIDIDYPQVSAVSDPDALVGTPTTITYDRAGVPCVPYETIEQSTWTVQNVDYFKAGFQYCIASVEARMASGIGFISIANAAGMEGLQRIIPIANNTSAIRYKLRYASKLTKGPMDVKVKLFAGSSTTTDLFMCHDYVKRGTA